MSTPTSIYFDFETGGIEDTKPEIQLAAIAVSGEGSELESFEAKIEFNDADADPEALKMNHYDPLVWAAQAMPRVEVVRRFDAFLEPYRTLPMRSKRTGKAYTVARLVAYNAPFDAPRLKRLFGTTFLAADPRVRCALQRAMWWFDLRGNAPENFQLSTVCTRFGIETTGAHDALTDVRLTARLMRKLDQLESVVAEVLVLPRATAAEIKERLSDADKSILNQAVTRKSAAALWLNLNESSINVLQSIGAL